MLLFALQRITKMLISANRPSFIYLKKIRQLELTRAVASHVLDKHKNIYKNNSRYFVNANKRGCRLALRLLACTIKGCFGPQGPELYNLNWHV